MMKWNHHLLFPESSHITTFLHTAISSFTNFVFPSSSSSPLLVLTACPVILSPQVNIDHFTKDVTLRSLVDLSPATFDLAQKRIYALMEKDSFGRFLRSEQYQELLVN